MSKRQMIPGIIGIVILTVILAGSVLAPVLAPYEVNAVDMSQTLSRPRPIYSARICWGEIFSAESYTAEGARFFFL
jgi:hypothetical protein